MSSEQDTDDRDVEAVEEAEAPAVDSTEGGSAGGASPERGDIWDTDRMNHLHDLPRFCPDCGSVIEETGGMAMEYWTADRRVYHVWCRPCGWTGDVTRVRRMIGPDSPH